MNQALYAHMNNKRKRKQKKKKTLISKDSQKKKKDQEDCDSKPDSSQDRISKKPHHKGLLEWLTV
jgi:hypothetical protein